MELPNAFAAYLGSGVLALVYLVLSLRFLRPLLMRVLPAPGEGPSRKQQVEGYWCARAYNLHLEMSGSYPSLLFARVLPPPLSSPVKPRGT